MKHEVEELRRLLVGRTLRIVCMKDEPHYTGRIGVVKSVDDAGQIHGSWGGCALIPGVDSYELHTPYDKVKYIMDKYHIFGECVEETDSMVGIEIRWGDWKHDHLCLSFSVTEAYPGVQYSCEVTEQDGSDAYSAIHRFKFKEGCQ